MIADVRQRMSTAIQSWTIDPAHSLADFSVKHMMIATVKGYFGVISGALSFDGVDVTTASARTTIEVASVNTGDAERDAHLRSPDFFHVDAHPTMTFLSTGMEPAEGNAYRLRGDLTLRGITRPVLLEVLYEGQITDPAGKRRAGFTAETTLSRKDFGLVWNQSLEAGGVAVSDNVQVFLSIEAIRQS